MAFQVCYLNCSTELQNQVSELIAAWQKNQTHFELKTSGSTGVPKRIKHHRDLLFASAERSNSFFNLNEDSHVLLAISPKYIGGMMLLIRALVGNYTISVIEASEITSLDQRAKFDFVSLVPLQIERIKAVNPNLLQCFSTILLGGTTLSNDLRDFLVPLHSSCYIGFGMTETVSHIAIRTISNDAYTCLNGVSVSEINNQLLIQDDSLGIRDLLTNDEVRIINAKQFYWLGRTDFVINSGGVKQHPEQLELTIRPFVQGDFIIAGFPHQKLGEVIVLLLAPESQFLLTFEEIQTKIEVQHGKYSAPKTFQSTPFVYAENGKLLRKLTIQKAYESV